MRISLTLDAVRAPALSQFIFATGIENVDLLTGTFQGLDEFRKLLVPLHLMFVDHPLDYTGKGPT